MSILYDDWCPSLKIESIILSLISMLSSAKNKNRPKNNDEFIIRAVGKNPKQFKWDYDDLKC